MDIASNVTSTNYYAFDKYMPLASKVGVAF